MPISRLLAMAGLLLPLASGTGCYSGFSGDAATGSGADTDGSSPSSETGEAPPDALPEDVETEVAVSGLRRLSITEYRQTVIDLVGIEPPQASLLLPEDALTPFDNDAAQQIASEALITGAESLAGDVAVAVIESPAAREQVVPCEPSGPDDAACFEEFVTSFGRRALRRTLTPAEIERFAGLLTYGIEVDDFWVAVEAALRAFLQHPEFLYRVEIGEPLADQPQVFRLDGFEVATRLSYFLIGSTPPDWLLDAAEAGELGDSEGVSAVAQQLLDTPAALDRIARFHGLWLAYEKLSREGLTGDMHAETRALLDRVIFEERRPWTDVLTLGETWVSPELAEHYGLTSPGTEAGWVPYGDSGRAGLLSHGSFLSVGSKFGDTSPTQRGLMVRTRLFCQEIPDPPPDLMVDVDEPPEGAGADACKNEVYYMSTEPACAGCHSLMDPIGFGLEQYDATGAFRTTEPGKPHCEITGEGDFAGVGTFSGPAELAQLAIEGGDVEACAARQLYRFAVGRSELDEHDEALLQRLIEESSGQGSMELFGLIAEYVGSDAFRYRREEVAP